MGGVSGIAAAALLAALVLAGCATTPPPSTEVTRFHLGQPIPADSIALTAAPGIDGTSLEFRSQAAVVAQDLATVGFRAAPGDTRTAYVGIINLTQSSRPGAPRRSPVQIGIGGGTGGPGGSVGGGFTVPLGKSSSGDVRVNELAVQIKRRSDNSMVWEGRVVQEIAADAPASSLSAALPALSQALFAGFPGPSGQAVKVKLPK